MSPGCGQPKVRMDPSLTHKIKRHRAIGPFNYDIAVDWAIDLMKNGIETDNVLMLASFSKPVDSAEIKPYVSAVLNDLGVEEDAAVEYPLSHIRYYAEKVAAKEDIRANIKQLFTLFLDHDHDHGLTPFYLLYFAWEDLETEGYNHYYDHATLDNIEALAVMEANKWLHKYFPK